SCAEVKAEESELTTFRLAVTFRVAPLKKLVPRTIPAGLPPGVVLRPLMLFEVTMAVMLTPVFGEPTAIPVMFPLVVLRVLIEFEVTLNVAEFVTFIWIPVWVPAEVKFVIVLDVTVALPLLTDTPMKFPVAAGEFQLLQTFP